MGKELEEALVDGRNRLRSVRGPSGGPPPVVRQRGANNGRIDETWRTKIPFQPAQTLAEGPDEFETQED